MAVNLGSVYGELTLDLSKWTNSLNQAQKSINTFNKNVSNSVQSSSNIFKSFGNTLNSVSEDAFKLGSAGLSAVAVALGAIGYKAISVSGDLQQYRNAYITLLKNVGEADRAIAAIKQDAAKTPFDLRTLIKANQMLISTGEGVDKSREAVLALGNAIVATGGGEEEFQRMVGNLQQIRNVGKATEMDIRQFGFAGINIYKLLSESTGKSVAQLKEMDISYDMLTKSLIKAGKAGGMFENALENQGSGWNLLKSNLNDVINIILSDVVTDTGLFGFLNEQLKTLVDYLTNNKQAIIEFFKNIGESIKSFIQSDDFKNFVNNFIAFGKWVYDNKDIILTFLGGMVAMFTALAVIGGVIALLNLLLNPLSLIVIAAGLVYTAFMNWDKISAFIMEFVNQGIAKFNEFKDQLIVAFDIAKNAVGDFFTKTLPDILNRIPSLLGDALKATLDALVFGIYFLIAYVMIGFPMFIDAIKNGIASIPSIMSNIWNSAKNAMIAIWNSIISFFTQSVPSFVNSVVKWLSEILPKITVTMNSFKDGMVNGAIKAWDGLINEIKTWPAKLMEWGSNVAKAFADGFGKLDKYLQEKAKQALESATKLLKGKSPPIAGPFKEIDVWGYNVGQAWADGLADGISGFKNTINGLTNDATSAFENESNLGVISPTFNVNIGTYAGSPMEKRELARELWNSLQDYNRSIGANIIK